MTALHLFGVFIDLPQWQCMTLNANLQSPGAEPERAVTEDTVTPPARRLPPGPAVREVILVTEAGELKFERADCIT